MANVKFASIAKFIRELAASLARDAATSIKPKIPHDALRDALRVQVEKNKASLYIPHYWAIYVHDTRGPFGPRRAQLLVWFTDPNDDPRLRGGYPVRFSDVKRLTKEQFQFGLRENARRLDSGAEPYMIVKRYEPSTRQGDFFFTIGAQSFEATVPAKVFTEVDRFVREQAAKIPQPKRARGKLR